MPEISPSRYLVMAGWDDVPHLDAKTKAELLASTPPHLRKARSQGIPTMGSGAVFPVDEALISWQPHAIPDHWVRIAGLDFGWDHPTAAVWCAWDRDSDTFYVYDAYRQAKAAVAIHVDALQARPKWIPVAWPPDGLQTEKGTGIQLAQQYRDRGVNLLPEFATLPETPTPSETQVSRVSVEAGLLSMLDYMQSGRFKVAAHLLDWWDEFRLYHREDGKIVKLVDDLMSATRYAFVMRRFACVKPRRNVIDYSNDDWRV